MKVTDVSKVTEAQKKTIGENYAVSIGMTIGKTDVHELGGKVKVNLALAPVPGKDMSKTKVYYVAEDGSIEEMPTSYKEGVVTFEVTHFSVYMVVLSEATPDPPVPTEYTVTIKIEGKGTATASVTKAVEGTKVTLTSEAAERYEFKEWKSSDVTISGNSFTMPAKNVIVTAVFEQEPDDDKGSDDGNVLLYVGIAVALIVVIAALVVFFRRRA
jgi:hypothetical protein